MTRGELHTRRVDAVRAWTSFIERGDGAETFVRPEILSSWARSEAAISTDVAHAPLADESETAALWSGSKYCVGNNDGVRKLDAAYLYKKA